MCSIQNICYMKHYTAFLLYNRYDQYQRLWEMTRNDSFWWIYNWCMASWYMYNNLISCVMFLGLIQAMAFISNSFFRPLHLITKNWFTTMCRNQICYLVLCNAKSFMSKASIKGHHPQSILCKFFKKRSPGSCCKWHGGWGFLESNLLSSVPFSQPWKLWDTVIPTSLQWIKYFSWWKEWMKHCLTHGCFLMMRYVWINEGSDYIWLQGSTGRSFWWNKYRKEWKVTKVREFLFVCLFFQTS